jgi:signal transduction histidine kinase
MTLPSAVSNVAVDVLAVDDVPVNLTALEAVLARPDVNVVRASSGAEALALMRTREFAVVILDAQMPILDGFEVARRIRENQLGAATPIIFLTAFDVAAHEVRRAYAAGAVDFVVKPFDTDVLRSKVAVFVDLFRKSREVAAAAAMRAWIERDRVETAAREAEYKRIDRMKDDFLATLAHELRTPLTSLVVAADSLERLPVQDATVTGVHDLIRGQLGHLCRLVEDLLDVSRFTQGKIALRSATIDLRQVVRRGIELGQAAIDAQGAILEVTLPTGPVQTYADPVRLAQVTSNLINNAAKFSSWGGKVAVSLERVEDRAVITVRDWGRGIPMPDLAWIFEPFAQSDASDTWRGGLGIGLALVKKLVGLHGGRVQAASEGSGRGAEFVVTLPLVEAPAEEGDRAAERSREELALSPAFSGEGEGSAPVRVLVVEDNSEVRSAVRLFLQLEGHSVVTADCARAALAEIDRTDPDVVLLDIDLPDLDGYEVAKRVRASRAAPRPWLVAMTGKVSPDERDRALRSGFDAHLPKPVDGRALLRVVAER